jgi:hypothetical protein
MTNTTWIKPGASVVTYVRPHGSPRWISRSVKVQKILRVNQQSFTVEDGTRFRLDNQIHRGNNAWSESSVCVSYGSAQARRVLKEAALRKAEAAADKAYDTWTRNRTEETLLAAIAALQDIPVDKSE